ncbi:MAG: hypothetical protein JNK82_14730, partial [Myxococcaceae bacterium]|nr:hypothetical protein [Myxococcaceae bacterium]
WVGEISERFLERFDVATGDRTGQIGGHGTEPGKFDGSSDVHAGPTDLAFDSAGNIYVNDPQGSRIMKLSPTGTALGAFTFGKAENVEPVAVDPRTGNVYVGRDIGVDIVCPF